MAILTAFLFAYFSSTHVSIAVPFPQSDRNENPLSNSVSYMSGSSTRGTVELLLSCSITFFVCIWTAVHTDVCVSRSLVDQTVYKFVWMVFMAFAPECVIWAAVSQWLQARTIEQKWSKYFQEMGVEGSKFGEWLGMEGAFFAVMGGFVLKEPLAPCHFDEDLAAQRGDRVAKQKDPRYPSEEVAATSCEMSETEIELTVTEPFVPCLSQAENFTARGDECTARRDDRDDLSQIVTTIEREINKTEYMTTVRGQGFAALLRSGVFLDLFTSGKLHEQSFRGRVFADKSKASGLLKFLSCIQVSWLFLQVVARLTSDLSTSLLEIHVVIQVVYAIIIYGFWWYKPLDVSEHIRIDVPSDYTISFTQFSRVHTPSFITEKRPSGSSNWLQMVSQAIYDVIETMGPQLKRNPPNVSITKHSKEPACQYSESETLRIDAKTGSETRQGIIFWALCGMLNGIVHLFAWKSHFPSSVERVLWIISCFLAAGCALSLLLLAAGGKYEMHATNAFLALRYPPNTVPGHDFCRRIFGNTFLSTWYLSIAVCVVRYHDSFSRTWHYGDQPPWQNRIHLLRHHCFTIINLLFAVYLLSLGFLILEAFASVRFMPRDVYTNVPWSEYWPHF